MKLGELRSLLADVPDDAEIGFENVNFGGHGDDINAYAINVSDDKKEVLLTPPYWDAVD